MAKQKSTDFMISFVEDYLNGVNSFLDYQLDFHYHLNQHYRKMERENPVLADCFYFYMAEMDFDYLDSLTDDEHMAAIKQRFDEFLATINGDLL